MTEANLARWWKYVDVTPHCWHWKQAPNNKGYGLFGANGRRFKAHRYGYEALVGPIPDGMVVDHLCRNRSCVNPSHLNIVTVAENNQNLGVRKDSKTGYRGVKFNAKLGNYQAQVTSKGVYHYLGVFDNPEDAHQAAVAKRNELFSNNIQDRLVNIIG